MSVWDKYEQPAKASIWDKYEKPERGVLGDVGAFITGSDRNPNIPTLSDIGVGNIATSQENQARIMGVIATSFDDERIKKGFQQAIPDAQYSEDEYGNLVVTAPTQRDEQGKPLTWERFYPNPKGLADPETAYQVAGAATAAIPAAVIGGPSLLASTLAGGAEAGIYEWISSSLANDDYRISEPIGGAAAGGLFHVAQKLLGSLVRKFKTKTITNADISAAQRLLREQGYDSEKLIGDVIRKVTEDMKSGIPADQSVRYRTAQNLPVEVPMSRGDVTGDKERQLLEDAILSGGYGETAKQRMGSLREAQQTALAENIPAIQRLIAGDSPVVQRSAGGQTAQESLVKLKGETKEAATDLYKAARAEPAYIDPDVGDQLAADIYNAVARDFPEGGAETAFKILREDLGTVLRQGQSLQDIFAARSRLSKLSAEGGTDGGAAGMMVGELDKALASSLDDAFLHGSPEAVKYWLDATANYRDFMRTWETEGVLKKLTSTSIRDGSTVLTVAPEEAANAIFGVALNPNKTNLARDLTTLKGKLPKDVWDGVRQEFFIKLSDTMLNAKGDVRGQAFATAWANVKKNKTLLNTLFSKEEQNVIDGLATTSLTIGTREANRSNSANSLLGAIHRFATQLGGTPTGQTLTNLPVARGIKEAVGIGQTAVPPMQAVQPYITPVSAFGGLVGAEPAQGLFEWLTGTPQYEERK